MTKSSRRAILAAVDALALALAGVGHVWTDRERRLYESAIRHLTA